MPGQLFSGDIQRAANGITTAPINLYVDPAGSDVTGDGTAGKPYATLTKALASIPEKIAHTVHLRYAGGTYTSFPTNLCFELLRTGQLVLECTDEPTVVAGPFTMSGVADLNTWSGFDITVAGAGWSVDAYHGKFIKITSGASAGLVLPIHYNSADTISTLTSFYSFAPGDSFNIVEPAAIVDTAHPITFGVKGSLSWGYSQLAIVNTMFSTSDIGLNEYLWYGNVFAVLYCTAFKVPEGGPIWQQTAGSINGSQMLDYGGIDDAIAADGYTGCVQFINNATAAIEAATDQVAIYPGEGSVNSGTSLQNFCVRNGFLVVGEQVQALVFAAGHVKVDHGCRASLAYGRVRVPAAHATTPGCLVDDGARLEGAYLYGDSLPQDGFTLTDLGEMILGDSVFAATRYGYNLGIQCRAILESGNTVSGGVDDLYFAQSAGTPAIPASGNSETDSQGSWISSK